jgi:hypothetical protein
MSCDVSIYCTDLVDLASYSALAVELRNHPAASDLKRSRSEVRGHIIPDSTETLPECVWGDEGPING